MADPLWHRLDSLFVYSIQSFPMTRPKRVALTSVGIILCVGALAAAIWPAWFTGSQNALVVYCAHDSVYADSVLKDFQKQTGIAVNVLYDSEATKSLGLVNQLKNEKNAPHCDVFWNNELLGTMELAQKGVLEPYKGAGYERIPGKYKDDEGRWAGFGARMRVWIVHGKEPLPTQTGGKPVIEERFEKNIARAAISNPLYGTTLTHFSILWQLRGGPWLKSWYADVRKKGIRILAGNARVKDAVAEGVCDLGWTDTDDCFEAIDDQKPVTMVPLYVWEPAPPTPPGLLKMGLHMGSNPFTIVIPNTVSLVRGSRHRKDAERLIDFLLSAETELTLANSKSRQIPLGKVDNARLPKDVRQLAGFVSQGYDLRKLEGARREVLAWLKTEPQ
jgi:iron(III) transport system substrate-binding protein